MLQNKDTKQPDDLDIKISELSINADNVPDSPMKRFKAWLDSKNITIIDEGDQQSIDEFEVRFLDEAVNIISIDDIEITVDPEIAHDKLEISVDEDDLMTPSVKINRYTGSRIRIVTHHPADSEPEILSVEEGAVDTEVACRAFVSMEQNSSLSKAFVDVIREKSGQLLSFMYSGEASNPPDYSGNRWWTSYDISYLANKCSAL